MSQFDYTLPSGVAFTMQAPEGTTQSQADKIFYSQVAAGALVGFIPGQSVSGTTSALAKFALSRLDRGTAGVDDTVILAIVNGLPATANIPSLVNVPLQNPVTRANIAGISSSGFTAPAIGSLTSSQTQALMAQVANNVDQAADTITNETGVGRYGFSCQQLEMAGYVKPGTWQQFLQNGSGTLVDVLGAPGIWTGLFGINSLTQFLNNINAQNNAQATLMQNGYSSLRAAGVIKTPVTQSVSAVRGEVYTGEDGILTSTTTTVTNSVNGQIAALVANSSKYGTGLTAQWATTPASKNQSTTQSSSTLASLGVIGLGLASKIPNLGSLLSGTSGLPSVQTAMDILGKASQFASTAASALSGGLDKLSNLSLDSLTDKLGGQATALAGQLQGQATALIGQAQAQADALIAQAQAQADALIAQGQGLVANVEKAAGFVNTVDRASVDVAMTKIFGSSKIPVPSLGADLPDSASIGAALDITAAQNKLQELQSQGTALISQVQGQAGSILSQAKSAVNQIG
jgi:hypothetical protein